MNTSYPYGSWPSPVTADLLTAQNLRLSEPQACGDSVFWLESRPAEKGRNALVQLSASGGRLDILPQPHSIRSRAHEYGGGSYLATEEFILCVLDADQRIHYFNRSNGSLTAISEENPEQGNRYRFADFCWDKTRGRVIAIREDYSADEHHPQSAIVAIALEPPYSISVLVEGADFYSNPRLNSSGSQLSYLCWNHPQMPWDGTECYCAELNPAGDIQASQWIAGSSHESIFQPQWSPDDQLFFVSDRNDWWNIYRFDFAHRESEIICESAAEFATPQWVFGMSSYGFLDSENIFCCFSRNGQWQMGIIAIKEKKLNEIPSEFKDISGVCCHQQRAYCLAASATHSNQLICIQDKNIKVLVQSTSPPTLTEEDISQPQAISFPTSDGETAYGFFYPPKNKNVIPAEDGLPPLLVICHGGPTGATETSLNLKTQFWSSRGFAVLDVNYRGSTGYGRHYRDRLKNNWGITDVIDVCSGVDYLVQQGLVDRDKVAIRGGSAGGYTVLAALTFSNTFKAGASLYGIGDLETLARDTHKFEARYLDSLVGPYPEQKATYIARSPIHHIEQLDCPVIFLQGLKDKVVPPQQAESMVRALREKGIRADYVSFTEEGHGFRQAENIKRAIEAELEFYQSVFKAAP
ncbi:MAG TPA: S9 family peptidase [Cellvibrio sp.]|nr:S9 family peptidase [Cellvibrio sp.]